MSVGKTAMDRVAWAWSDWVPPFAFFVLALAIWEAACLLLNVQEYVLPAPTAIARQIALNIEHLSWHTGITLLEAGAGFLIANLLSFACAVFFTYSPLFERSAYPYLVGLKSVPIVALAPLITLWFGDGLASKIAMAALITFFPMVVNATVGLKSVDRRALDLMRVLRADEAQILYKLRMPASIPYVTSALKISAPLAVVGAIVAEIAGAASGIGYLILVAAYRVDTPFMFACIIFAAVAGLMFFGLAVLIERLLTVPRRRARDDPVTVMRLLRSGAVPSVELAESVSRGVENTRRLKKLVGASDEAGILKWLVSDEPAIVELACVLCSPLVMSGEHPQLVEKLGHMWKQADTGTGADPWSRYVRKHLLMWRLLDDPAIDATTQTEMLQFIEANWEQWRRHCLQWNDELGIALSMKKRLEDPNTPERKAWIYLVTASIDLDKKRVCDLMGKYAASGERMVADVANRILDNQGFLFLKEK